MFWRARSYPTHDENSEVQQNPDARGYSDRLIKLIYEIRNTLSDFEIILMTPFPLVTEDPAPYWIYRHEVISLGERFNISVFDSWVALLADEGPVNVDVYQKDEVSSLVDPSGWTQKGNEKLWPKLKVFLERTLPVHLATL